MVSDDRDYHEKVSRLEPLSRPLSPQVEALFEELKSRGSSILNLHLVSAQAPDLAAARRPLIAGLRSDCKVPRLYRELAITRAAQMVGCEYEVHHHTPFLVQCGLSEEAVGKVEDWQNNRASFDTRQLAVLAYVEEMCGNKGNVSDAVFDELAAHFEPGEIYELTIAATTYYAGGMEKNALGLIMDPDDRKPAPGKF